MTAYEALLLKHGMKLTDEQAVLRRAWLIPAKENRRNFAIPTSEVIPAFDSQGWRICCICYEAKPPESYTKGGGIDGKDARCKPCKAIQAKELSKRRNVK